MPTACRVTSLEPIGPRATLVRLEPLAGELPRWAPGQRAPLAVRAPGFPMASRLLPIASSPHERGSIVFAVKADDPWTLAFLDRADGAGFGGDDLALVGRPRGRFGRLADGRRASGGPVLMIAGGIGVAPFLSMIERLAWADSSRPARLLWWARTREDLAASGDFAALAKTYPAFSFTPVTTHDPLWTGERGRLDAAMLARLVPAAWVADPRSTFLVCAPPGMARAAATGLRALGVRGGVIGRDVDWGRRW